jgi:hypothetical protein
VGDNFDIFEPNLIIFYINYFAFQTKDEDKKPNVYHKALLQWGFQRGLEGFRHDLTQGQHDTPVHPTALINR